MNYTYTIAHAEDFEPVENPVESIDNQREGIASLARMNDNPDGETFELLRSDENGTVFCYEKNKWVEYG